MKEKVRKCPGCKKISCDGCRILKQLHTNKQMAVAFPGGFEPEAGEGFGLSFDIGTTTLAGMLWDLEQAVCLEAKAMANPQIPWGSDVIERIGFAIQGQAQTTLLQRKLIQAMDEMAKEMAEAWISCLDENAESELISKVTVAGNTAMCEIFLGTMPQGLAKAPFTPDYKEMVCRKGAELGFVFLKDAEISVMPPVGGYVGADALAVYSCMREETREKNVLAIDIGTNGEILLVTPRKKYACSTAAGPALEGGGAACGMRAVKGAVDAVTIGGRFPMQDLACHVIGEGKPIGICGSGLLDALACLVKCGVTDHDGYLRSRREARAAGVPERICQRIEELAAGNCILLTERENPVYLTGEDIRQLQLAIGAVRAGAEVLLERAGLTAAQLDAVLLAGAFGSYLRTESCLIAGLLPKVEKEQIVQAGNLAGTGAAMALLSEKVLKNTEEWAEELCHVELAEDKRFQELFLQYMSFEN